MRKIRLALATLLACFAGAGVAASTASAYPSNFGTALNYAQGKCLRYTGCSGIYVDQLSYYQSGGQTIYQGFRFHTTYCGWKNYDVAIYSNGSIVWQYLYGGSC